MKFQVLDIKNIFLVFLIITSTTTHAEPKTYGSATVLEVRSIYDGDTFRATLEGLHPLIGESIPIRVNGIDTPE